MLLFSFLFGLTIGSFLNVCIYRVPRGLSVVNPPSGCPRCGTRLTAPDLVPVFSWLFLRGRCRHCEAAISPKYPLVELLTGFVFAFTWWKLDSPALFLAFAFLGAVMLAVFFVDVEQMLIPDGFVVVGVVGGVTFQAWSIAAERSVWWDGLSGVLMGSGVFFLVALLSGVILKRESMGIGDVKFMAVVGLFLGLKLIVLCLFLSVVLGGIVGAVLLLTRVKKAGNTEIPFGPFIVLGAFICIFFGNEMIAWYLNSFLFR